MIDYQHHIDHSMTYAHYRNLIETLLAQNQTTGTDQTQDLVDYAKLNAQRMKRWEKTATVKPAIQQLIETFQPSWHWLIITEGWCGDAAQCLPMIEKIAHLAPNISTHYVLRDENLPLIDAHLVRGGRSIPIVVVLDKKTLKVIGSWGPRPKACQKIMDDLTEQQASKAQKMEAIHGWYAENKNEALQDEFEHLMEQWHKN